MTSLTSPLLLPVLSVKTLSAIDRISQCYSGFMGERQMDWGYHLMKHLCTVRIKIHNLKEIFVFFVLYHNSPYH